MELLPILSIIILVATVTTLVLAVCAYILFKIQSKKPFNILSFKQESEEAAVIKPEDFGGRTLPIRKSKKTEGYVKHYKPIGESLLNQQKIDKNYQETERKKIKRKPTEPKYLKFNNENRNGSIISWR